MVVHLLTTLRLVLLYKYVTNHNVPHMPVSDTLLAENPVEVSFSWTDMLKALWYFAHDRKAQAVTWQILLTLIYVLV